MDSSDHSGLKTANGIVPYFVDVLKECKVAIHEFATKQTEKWIPYGKELAAIFTHDISDGENSYGIDKNSLVAASCVFRQLSGMTDPSFDTTCELLSKSPVWNLDQASVRNRSEYVNRDGATSTFQENGKVQDDLIRDVRRLFKRCLKNAQFFSIFDMYVSFLSQLVTVAHIIINEISEEVNGEPTLTEKNIFTIGGITFPDKFRSSISVFKIDVKAYMDSRKLLFDDVYMHGVSVDFESATYNPQLDVLEKLNDDMVKKALQSGLHTYSLALKGKCSVRQPSYNKEELLKRVYENKAGIVPTFSETSLNLQNAFIAYNFMTCSEPAIDIKMTVLATQIGQDAMMHDDTLVAVASVNHVMKTCQEISFKEFEVCLQTNPIVCNRDEDSIVRYDKLCKDGENVVCIQDGKPVPEVEDEIRSWFLRLISTDRDVPIFEINYRDLVQVLEDTCRFHDQLKKDNKTNEFVEKPLIDYNCLIYPNKNQEAFQLVKIKISAFAECRSFNADDVIKKHFDKLEQAHKRTATENETKSDENGVVNKLVNFADLQDIESAGTESDVEQGTELENGDSNFAIDTCGFSGEFHCYNFLPRRETMCMLTNSMKKIAINQGKRILGLNE